MPTSLMSPLEDWDGISVPPTPHILTDGQEALQRKEGWINIHTLGVLALGLSCTM